MPPQKNKKRKQPGNQPGIQPGNRMKKSKNEGSVGDPIHGNIRREDERVYRRLQILQELAKKEKNEGGPAIFTPNNETIFSSQTGENVENGTEETSRKTDPPINSYNVFNKKSRATNKFVNFDQFLKTEASNDLQNFQVKIGTQTGDNLELTSKFGGGHTYTIRKEDVKTISESFASIAQQAQRVISDPKFNGKLNVDMYVICTHDKDKTKLLKGYLILVCFYTGNPEEPVVFNIYDVVTVPEFRRQGVMLELFYKTKEFMSVYTQNRHSQQYFLQFGVLKSNSGALKFYRELISRNFLYVLHIESVLAKKYPTYNDNGKRIFPYPFDANGLGEPYIWLTFVSEASQGILDVQRAVLALETAYRQNLKHNYLSYMKSVHINIDTDSIGRDTRLSQGVKYVGIPEEDTAGYILSMKTETGFSCGLVGPDERGQYSIRINQYVPGSTTEFSTHIPYNINFSTATTTPPDSPTVFSLGNGHVHPNICYNLYGCILGLPSSGDLINAVHMYMEYGLPFTLIMTREGLYVITFKEEHALELGIGTSEATAAAKNYDRHIKSQVTSSKFYEEIFTFYQFLLKKESGINVRVRFIAKGDTTNEYNCNEWRHATGGVLNYYKQMTVRVYKEESSFKDVDYSQENINSNFDDSFKQVMDIIEEALGSAIMEQYVQEHIEEYLKVYYNSFIPHDQPGLDFDHVALIKWEINGDDRLLPYYKKYLKINLLGDPLNMSIVDIYPLIGNSNETLPGQSRGGLALLPARV